MRDYQFQQFSRSVYAISAPAISAGPIVPLLLAESEALALMSAQSEPFVIVESQVIERPEMAGTTTARPEVGTKMYQFVSRPTLVIDHCMVSKMAMVIDETGHWTVSLRADQNPLLGSDNPDLINRVVPDRLRSSVLQTSQILRNRFHIRVKGYANTPAISSGLETDLGFPAVFEVCIPPFWVQKGRSREMRWEGNLPPGQAARAFSLVNRIGIEFSYELPQGMRADLVR